jgi:hypothetical protein
MRRSGLFQRIRRCERGVALVTVIFVAAGLTVVSSAGALIAVQELRSGTDDRKATEALSYAESGIDRMMQHLRGGTVTWAQMKRAGCEDGPITLGPTVIGNGTFTAKVWVYDPDGTTPQDKLATQNPRNVAPASTFACGDRPTTPRDGLYVAIESTGEHPAAKRIVEQVVLVEPRNLPIGVVAESIEASGTPQTYGISMISEEKIIGREKITFTGTDPYYTVGDFWPGGPWPAGVTEDTPIPSAGHAVQGIYMKSNGSNWEFASGAVQCNANGAGGQSLWDSDGNGTAAQHGPITSGCAGQTGYPPNSYFTNADRLRIGPDDLDEADHRALKQAAQNGGLYCTIGGSTTCTMLGSTVGYASNWQDGDIAPIFAAGVRHFVAYFEFTTGSATSNNIRWKADVKSDSGAICDLANPNQNRSVVIVVRNGGASLENGADINGAMILDGDFKYTGNVTFNGTIMANEFDISGTSTFRLDDCWVQNMPGPYLDVTPEHWRELDR